MLSSPPPANNPALRNEVRETSSHGLESETPVTDGPDSKKKKITRPRTRDRDTRRFRAGPNKEEEANAAATFSSPFASMRAQHDVPIALDTNFDQIDDIVDTSKRNLSLVGPKDERLSMGGEAVLARPNSAGGQVSPGPARQTRDRSTSVSFLEEQRRSSFSPSMQIQSEASPQRPQTLRRLATTSGGTFSRNAENIERGQLARADTADTRLLSLSWAEAAPNLSDRSTPTPGEITALSSRSRGVEDESHLALFPSKSSRDERKASYASTSSRLTLGSDVSPTTSVSNVNKLQERRPLERPPPQVNTSEALNPMKNLRNGTQKGDSSGAKVAWSAPDSWAVAPQKGKLQDFLRDGDGDGQDEEEDSQNEGDESTASIVASPSSFRLENKGRPSIAGSTLSGFTAASGVVPSDRSESVSTALPAREFRHSRRETVDSNMSSASAQMNRERLSKSEEAEEELLASAGAQAPGTPASLRTGSRGGAIGTAAAAAAGKLGLHRQSRSKTSSRPSTADIRAGTTMSSGQQHATDDAFSSARVSKRTPSGQTVQKNSFVRIWRDDGTHTVVSISMTATTADLRAILSRKMNDTAGVSNLYVRDKGSERPLGETERPASLQRRRLEQAGFNEADALDELGREDLSFLVKFVYRPDRTPYFDPNAFGNTEADFNVLDLRKLNLEMVPIFLYRHAEWIKSLNLSGNPMRDIPSDFVQLCTNLTTLCLSHLALKRIPQSVKQASRLTHLDISDNRIPELSHINLSEIPQLMSLKVQNNRLSELPSYFEQMQTVRDLNISNNRFEVFPAAVCQMHALSQLDASFNTISELPAEISELQQLQRLVLVGNTIVELPTGINTLNNLQAIDMRRNLLVNATALFGLPKLEILHCQHNAIKQLDVTFGPRLRTLEIGRNPLSKAIFQADATCALTTLNLSSANISKLDNNVLSRLPKLTSLVLNNNNMLALPDNLGDLTQLKHLSCTHNVLASLPETLGALGNLVELQVHDNNLKSLPPSIWMCGNLETINISSNVLESFPPPPAAFKPSAAALPNEALASSAAASAEPSVIESRKTSVSSLSSAILPASAAASTRLSHPLSTSLTKLRLADNRLTEDVFAVVSHMTELRVLNLSYNGIYELPNYGLSKLVKLRELYLSGNTLGSVPADELPLLSDLRVLHLNGNRLQTLPAELGKVKQLVNLDVGNNNLKYNISNQQYDWNWNSNPNLRCLNLSGNNRLEIKSNPVIVGGPNQPTAYKRTDSSDFQRLTDLRLLGLIDVTVTLHQMPDESGDRRVRTSLSQINQMAYGISDALGQHDHLSIIDVVVPRFRKMDNECLFGLFAGRGHSERTYSRIAFHLSQWINFRTQWEVQRLQQQHGDITSPNLEKIPDILRRAFLRMQKEYADTLLAENARSRDSSAAAEGALAANWRSGASAVMAYVIDRTLFIANVGDALAIVSHNGDAVPISTKHEPFDRNETLRIRSAEGWVSLHGQVNDMLDVSRSFGHYHLVPIVNAAPAVTRTELTDSHEFVILANSTLWDYIPYQTAVDIARMDRDDPMLAAQKLRDFAISYGAEGSIMVMVVSVGDLFAKSRGRRNLLVNGSTHPELRVTDPAAALFEPAWDSFKKTSSRRGREALPGDRTLARLQREVAPPVGQVALVFSDIRNSTALWETNNGMPSAWRQHNILVRRQLRSIGGYEVKNEGDAFMLSFQSVTSALLFCFQVQIQLLKENWPQEILESDEGKEVFDEQTGELIYRGLSVRMGIHWGWPVCEADPITRRMDYFGPMVNRASRVSSAAEGGQIFASRDVITELRAIMGTVEDGNKRRNLMDADETEEEVGGLHELADEDGINEEENESFRLLQANESRDIVLLRRMGFAISELGERNLKGLETPELLNLVYPKCLTARFSKLLEPSDPVRRELTAKGINSAPSTPRIGEGMDMLAEAGRRLNKHKPAVEVFEPTEHLLSVEDIKSLGYLCLRLEAIAQGQVHDGVSEVVLADKDAEVVPRSSLDSHTSSHALSTRRVSMSARMSTLLPPPTSRQMAVEAHLNNHPELLLSGMRDDATDEELQVVLQELTGRICVALSSLALRKFVTRHSSVRGQAAQPQAFGMDLMDIIDLLQRSSLQAS